MILRRVIDHFRRQEWTAIFLDFVIVVFGVFVGLQVNNWNEAQAYEKEYQLALERLDSEISQNLMMLDELDRQIAASLSAVEGAVRALASCEDAEANRSAVNRGVSELAGTYGLALWQTALTELTESPNLLAQQSPAFRQQLSDARFQFNLATDLAKEGENYPADGRYVELPILGFGPRETVSFNYLGMQFSKSRRSFILKSSVSEACKTEGLDKAFGAWERSQSNVPVFSRQVRRELSELRHLLGAERR